MPLRRLWFAVPVALVVAATAGAAAWWFFGRETNSLATNAPAVPADLASTAAPGDVLAGGARTFRIIPERSEAAYFVDEKLAELPLPSKAKGSTHAIAGEFHLTATGLAADAPSRFTVDLRTLKSDRAMRDRRVQNQGLETATYPTATFTATGVTPFDAEAPEGEEQSLQLTGILDLHGVQREVTWDVKARRSGDVITALATTTFKFADFNIPVLNIAGFVSVQDDVTLQVHVVAQAV
jgi:polyisoprenoid-binding protein YceI